MTPTNPVEHKSSSPTRVLKLVAAGFGLCALALLIAGMATDSWRESMYDNKTPKYKKIQSFGLTHSVDAYETSSNGEAANGKCGDREKLFEDYDTKCGDMTRDGTDYCACRTAHAKYKEHFESKDGGECKDAMEDKKWYIPGLAAWGASLLFIFLGLVVWGAMTSEGTDDDQISCTDGEDDIKCPMGYSSILGVVGLVCAFLGTIIHAVP
ncbi:unnamed protein product [Vitrella brassicaformis CCMP3155]|uniref:Uncharacterized protein n=1 Tax=Vitrella brassicaformis (strain CCMP3155) TaxID=1169540 RepID=A0A0G4EAU9_VITBC|nr:unnamed protein product [Vitrella brassicaformis CCMP3155]|eukprot:CEL93033.1 unnamed protein product [Vitrella brassicaformis CCMP3155]